MPAYMITIGMSHNRFRRISRIVEAPDQRKAIEIARRRLDAARNHLRGQCPYDMWTVSKVMSGRISPVVIASGTIADQP